MAPLDSFLGIGSAANEANLAATTGVYRMLYSQIKAVDPNWRFDELEPLEAMDAQGRTNTIKDLLMEWAEVYYRVRGDIGPIQVETLRFLENAVDNAHADAVRKYNSGEIRGFFAGKSEPEAAIIVRPSQLVDRPIQRIP